MTLEDAQKLEASQSSTPAKPERPERKAVDRPQRPPAGRPLAGTPADPAGMDAVGTPAPPEQAQADPTQARQRPPGELGGHTVQDWEQKSVGEGSGSSSRSTPSSPATSKGDMGSDSPADFPAKASAKQANPGSAPIGGEGRTLSPTPTSDLAGKGGGGKAGSSTAPQGTTVEETASSPVRPAAQGHDVLVDSISTKLGEMLARALKQSVAEAVDEALSKGWQADKQLPPAAPNTTAAGKGNPPNVKEPPKPGPAAA